MLMLDSPVARSTVPLASDANVLTMQVDGKPLTSTGGPKKQLASKAHPPARLPHWESSVHSIVGSPMQCLVACGPFEQSRGPVPKLATRFVPSDESRMLLAFSGIRDGGTIAAPPPMFRQPRPRLVISVVALVSE